MSSVESAFSGVTGDRSDNIVVKLWENHVRGILFGVLYAMAKENALGSGFVIASTVFEFLQMTIFCFRAAFHWGGIHFDFDLNASMIGYYAYSVLFWIVLSVLALAFANAFYIGYTFYKGEVRSIYLLKLLRWVVSLFISVLFIPILFILFSGMACDYSTVPARLLLYPTEECWGGHTAIGVVAISLVVIFSILSLVATMTYYEHDPNMTKSSARLQNRFELAALITKLVLVVVTVFLMDDYLAFAIVSFAGSLFLMLASIVMLPFYETKLNMVRSGSYAGIFWVNVWMMIAYVLNDEKNIITTVCGTVGVPFAIAAGAFVAYRRFYYLCDPALVDGYVSSTEEQSPIPEKSKKVKKGVNWEQPKANKLMKNHLYSRLMFPWDVEIAARFVHVGKPNAAMIEKGKAVYQTGISKFPKSPTVLQAYANFMFTTVGDWQLGYVMLEKLRKMQTMIDIQFFVYRYDKDRERRIEGGSERIGDFVDFMEYKKLQQAARRHHMTSLVCVRKFWSYLLESKVDVMELSVLSGRIANAEKKASEQYAKLVQNHPKNVRVLRDYARFLDEVVQDEVAAQEFRKKADKYEQREMQKLTDSVRSSVGNIPQVPLDQLVLPAASEADDEIQTEPLTLATTTNDNETTSSKNIGGSQTRLMSAKLDKHSSLKKLGYIMLATTVFVMVIVLAELGILNNQFARYKYSVDAQNGAGGAAHTVVRVARGLADAFAIGQNYGQTGDIDSSLMWTGDYPHLQSGTKESIIVVGNNLKALYWGTSHMSSFSSQRLLKLRRKYDYGIQINTSDHKMKYGEFDHVNPHRKAVEKFFNDPIYNATIYVPDNTLDFSTTDRTYKTSDLWSMCSILLSVAEEVSMLPISAFADVKVLTEYATQFNYAIENSPEVAIGMHALVSLYAKNVEESLDQLLITCLIMFVVSVALLLLGSLLIFRPIVQQIFTSKVRTFSMFTLIPRDVVKLMSKKKIITLGLSEASSSGDEMTGFSTDDAAGESDGANEKKIEKKKLKPKNKFPKWTSAKNLAITKPRDKAIKKAVSAPQLEHTTDDERESAVLHTPRARDSGEMKMLLPNASDVLGSDGEPEPSGQFIRVQSTANFKRANPNSNSHVTPGEPQTPRVESFESSGPANRFIKRTETVSMSGLAISMDHLHEPSHVINVPKNEESSSDEGDDEREIDQPPSTFQKFKRRLSAIAFKLPQVRSLGKSYKKVGKEEDDLHEKEKERIEKEKEKAKKVSRLDVSSLRAVTWKLHFSYLIAIACIIIALCVSYFLTRAILGNLVKIAGDLRSSDFRTQYAQVLALDIATLTVYPHTSVTAITAAEHAVNDFEGMWDAYNNVVPMSYQMDYLFTSDCLKIDEEKCPKPGDPFYTQQEYGFNNLFFNFFFAGKQVFDKYTKTNSTLAYDDPLYVEFRTLGETVFDGMEYLTWTVYVDALQRIDRARNYVSIITAVECIVFALIYIILFRPFVKQLREENNHTFSIIRMIPKKLLRDVPEIQEFIQETLDPENTLF